MKLYELARDKGFRIKCETFEVPPRQVGEPAPENEEKTKLGDYIIFHHIDGMYSYCTVEGQPDKVVHLSAGTELKKADDGEYYEIV